MFQDFDVSLFEDKWETNKYLLGRIFIVNIQHPIFSDVLDWSWIYVIHPDALVKLSFVATLIYL